MQSNLVVPQIHENKNIANCITTLQGVIYQYKRNLEKHPIAKLAAHGWLSRSLLQEFAKIQFVDSTLWIPMLSLIKGRIIEPRLLKAVTDNILCESGYHGIPHTTLCANFAKSVGVSPFYGDCHGYSPLSMHPVEIMNAVTGMSEPEICGWLLAAETLVPTLFQIFRPAFAKLPGVDLTYLDEHISVDSDDHARWMLEGATKLLEKSDCLDEILAGVNIGGRVTLSMPDVLYSKALRASHAV
jgi:pyrroloquinoline quinone (PQQ) biosynthesis protein C